MKNTIEGISLRSARITIGAIVLCAHLGTIVFYLCLPFFRDFQNDEVLLGIFTVAPLGSLYSLTYLKYLTLAPNELASEKGQTIDGAPFYIQAVVVILFSIALLVGSIAIVLSNGSVTFLPTYTGAVDTFFGAYIATIFGALFPPEIIGQRKN